MSYLFKVLVGILVLGLLVVVTGCIGNKDRKENKVQSDYSLTVKIDDVIINSVKLD